MRHLTFSMDSHRDEERCQKVYTIKVSSEWFTHRSTELKQTITDDYTISDRNATLYGGKFLDIHYDHCLEMAKEVFFQFCDVDFSYENDLLECFLEDVMLGYEKEREQWSMFETNDDNNLFSASLEYCKKIIDKQIEELSKL